MNEANNTYFSTTSRAFISLITGTNTELNQKVLDYELDGAFVTDDYEHPDIAGTEAFREELELVYPPGNDSIEQAVRKGVLVFPRPCAYRDRLEKWIRTKGLPLKQKMEMGSADGLIKCVAAGMGVSILPYSIIENGHKNGIVSVQEIGKTLASVPIIFIKRRDTFVTKPLEAFLELLTDQTIVKN